MRFSVFALLLSAMPLLAMGATVGPMSDLGEYADPHEAQSLSLTESSSSLGHSKVELELTPRQGVDPSGCYAYQYCDPRETGCYKVRARICRMAGL